jgi:hypothetical protein
MSGTFAAQEFIYQHIRVRLPVHHQTKLVRPKDSINAVVRGAVMAGFIDNSFSCITVPWHLLIEVPQLFDLASHPRSYRMECLDGQDRCRYIAVVLASKGQRLVKHKKSPLTVTKIVSCDDPWIFEDTIYLSMESNAPKYVMADSSCEYFSVSRYPWPSFHTSALPRISPNMALSN